MHLGKALRGLGGDFFSSCASLISERKEGCREGVRRNRYTAQEGEVYTRAETADLKEGKRQNMRSRGTWDGIVTANHKPMATPVPISPNSTARKQQRIRRKVRGQLSSCKNAEK
jgi:hypothetical protein